MTEQRSNIESKQGPGESESGIKSIIGAVAVGAATLAAVSGETGTIFSLLGDVLNKIGEGASAIHG